MKWLWDQGGIWNSGAYGRLGRVRGGPVTYGDIFTISLYRVIGRIRMMTLHLGVLNEESDTRGRT